MIWVRRFFLWILLSWWLIIFTWTLGISINFLLWGWKDAVEDSIYATKMFLGFDEL